MSMIPDDWNVVMPTKFHPIYVSKPTPSTAPSIPYSTYAEQFPAHNRRHYTNIHFYHEVKSIEEARNRLKHFAPSRFYPIDPEAPGRPSDYAHGPAHGAGMTRTNTTKFQETTPIVQTVRPQDVRERLQLDNIRHWSRLDDVNMKFFNFRWAREQYQLNKQKAEDQAKKT